MKMGTRPKLIEFKKYVSVKLSHLKAYFYFLFIPQKPNATRVLIFAQGRTGSTLLEELLGSTSYFGKGGELLGDSGTKVKYPYQFVSGIANKASNKNFIFHLKIYHLTRDRTRKIEPSSFLKKLQENGWKIVYLQRKNKLNHVLSNTIAEARSGFHKYDNQTEKFSFNLEAKHVVEKIEERARFENAELAALSGLDFLKITYEDDLKDANNHQNTVNKILDHLGLERKECRTSLKKINRSAQRDVIENYDEVITHLRENNMAHHIE
ncbi:MAG: hypothetical protein AB8H47_10625 [Bacteroidia bacterium]